VLMGEGHAKLPGVKRTTDRHHGHMLPLSSAWERFYHAPAVDAIKGRG
jgi:hypothetical protein